ncbi:phytanoyl-CoA dioxygenase family protein [Spirosoma sp. 209]|uniref:phytanoyl-CoA dioxygenase family protein n=1 Tax=Spirosoma sp. 209 TaxID=1955701 RepID=UPI00098D377C|nr:phytanoyl-CoA dioxygenase family protein [Spirosoma sp. 209]
MGDQLTNQQVEQFIRDGFVRIDQAFTAETAQQARTILWADMQAEPDDPATWLEPVVRLGMYSQPPFQEAANTAVLHRAFDQLVGPDYWIPCRSMGSFPVRFPSATDPGDTGWHVDASFPGADPANYVEWRVNVRSTGRGLLMLFLFSDVGEHDAPTRIRVGSHQDVAQLLEPAGEQGLSFIELAEQLPRLPARDEVVATGKAGTVYLCHPFLAHAAQPHHGTAPRFLAQPPLLLRRELEPTVEKATYSPVEAAIRAALA